MDNDVKMTAQEYQAFEKEAKKVFDIVRVLDENLSNQVVVEHKEEHKEEVHAIPVECYAFWGKNQRCENCISAKVMMDKNQHTKLEIMGTHIYQVFSKYAEIDGKPCAIEMLSLMEEDTMVDSRGRDELINMLSDYKKELYADALTGCYNRRYYEECLKDKQMTAGVAMLDLDQFKECNDTFGHDAGDLALKTVVQIVTDHIRKSDMLVRMGGDEFMLVMLGTDEDILRKKLELIREKVAETTVLGYRKMHLTVSIGGVITQQDESIAACLRRADEALYEAKEQRNKVVISA